MTGFSWGVLSTARIGTAKVIPAIQASRSGRVVAIASRSVDAARQQADRLGIARAYGSYEELLADPAIDGIYNPLPNHLHVPWTIRALEAGKHVLCEKPVALTAEEAATLIAARERTGRQVLEAFMVRQHPQWLRTRELVHSGELGEVRAIQSAFCYFNTDPTNIRNLADIGGGALYDIGCYCIVISRFLFSAEPDRVVALINRDPAMRTDRLTSALLAFPGGRQSAFICSTQLAPYQRIQVLGTKKRAEVMIPVNAPPDVPTRILVDDARAHDGSGVTVETFPACDQYALQADEAVATFRGEKRAAFPIEDAVRNMRVVDALYRSGASGEWQPVAAPDR
jgi:predicted dehydrogenase